MAITRLRSRVASLFAVVPSAALLMALGPAPAAYAGPAPAPSLGIIETSASAFGGLPFTMPMGFSLGGGPESDPVTVSYVAADGFPGFRILSVPTPADPHWNCAGSDVSQQIVSCVYTPSAGSPLQPGANLSVDVNAVAPYQATFDQEVVYNGASSADGGTGEQLTNLNVSPDGVTLNLDLTDSLGSLHSAPTGATFDYVANVTIGAQSAGAPAETQPVTITDPLPGGTELAAPPSGGAWDCGASTSSQVVCTYDPPADGIPQRGGLPTLTIPVRVTDPTVGDTLANTATATSADTGGATATDTVTVGDTILVIVSGFLPYGSSTPTLTYTSDAPTGVTLFGPLSCSAVTGTSNGHPAGFPIAGGLGAAYYTIYGPSCSGLSASAPGYVISYEGADGGFEAYSQFPQLDPGVSTFSAYQGVPFMDSAGFTVYGAPESAPVTITLTQSTYSTDLTFLSVPQPSDPKWNCAASSLATQTIVCVYTPTAPLLPRTSLSVDFEAVGKYNPSAPDDLLAVAETISSADAGNNPNDPVQLIDAFPDGVTLSLNLTDTLGAAHAGPTGTSFDYVAAVTIGEQAQGAPAETQPVTVTDPLPAGTVPAGPPSGSGWVCPAPTSSPVVCTYDPPAGGIPQGTTLPTLTIPARLTDATPGDMPANTATATSSDTGGATSTDTVTVSSFSLCPTSPLYGTGPNLAGDNLAGRNLHNDQALAGADLAGANLTGANLQGADLDGANLAGADLAGANLLRVQMTGANLAGDDVAGANLQGAHLSCSGFQGANLMGSNLLNADLTKANLGGAKLVGANIHGDNLTGADLSGATFANPNTGGVTWSSTTCPNGYVTKPSGDTCVGHGLN